MEDVARTAMVEGTAVLSSLGSFLRCGLLCLAAAVKVRVVVLVLLLPA